MINILSFISECFHQNNFSLRDIFIKNMFKLKFVFLLIFLASIQHYANGQTAPVSSVSSLDWEYKQIELKMRDYQERLRSYIKFVQNQLNNTITTIGTSASFVTIITTLKTAISTLENLATLSSYNYELINVTCDNIAVKTNSIVNDNLRISSISVNVAVNGSKVVVENSKIGTQLAIYNSLLSNERRIALQNCSNSLAKLSDMYTQYTVLLANSIVKYNLLYVQLILTKNQYCTGCITNFKPNDTKALAVIDNDVIQIQNTLNEIEGWIFNASKEIIMHVNSVNPVFKNSTSLYRMAVNLDNIANLVQGFLQLNTLEYVNETANCDDNNWKIALQQYKIYLYGQMMIEANLNSSFLCVNQIVTEGVYLIDKNIMTKSQQETCNKIFDLGDMVVEYFRQYVNSLMTAAYIKLPFVVMDLKNIQGTACDCSGTNATTAAPTTTTTSKYTLS
jgi:hypothetical protein